MAGGGCTRLAGSSPPDRASEAGTPLATPRHFAGPGGSFRRLGTPGEGRPFHPASRRNMEITQPGSARSQGCCRRLACAPRSTRRPSPSLVASRGRGPRPAPCTEVVSAPTRTKAVNTRSSMSEDPDTRVFDGNPEPRLSLDSISTRTNPVTLTVCRTKESGESRSVRPR